MEGNSLLVELQGDLSPEDEAFLKAMFEAGLQWGRKKSLTHPKMRQFIFSSRGELEIIDLVKTLTALKEAKNFIAEVVKRRGSFLLIGSQPAARNRVREVAEELGFPYVNGRWLGGTLTNFKTFQSRINHLNELEKKIQSPEFSAYTKKERGIFEKEYAELKAKFAGLANLAELPAALFVIGIQRHQLPVLEARKKRIPIVAVLNTNDNPTLIDYPIPANDNSSASVAFILDEFRKAVLEAREALSGEASKPENNAPQAIPQTT